MKDQDTLYTGQLTYKEIEFTFVFDRKELWLIPPKDKKQEIEEQWLGTQIAPGLYTPNIPVMEDSHLSGICNESGRKIVLLTKRGSYIATHGNHLLGYSFVLSIKVIAYVVFKYDRSTIDRISFANSEINAIHPVNKSFTFSLGTDFEEFNQNGIMTLTTKDFDSTTTEAQKFSVDDKDVVIYFTISRGVSTKIGEAPLSLDSSLIFEFSPTNDYEFILRLWYIAKDFLSFLCYRRDIYLPITKLSAPCPDGKHEEFATLYVVGEDGRPNKEDLEKGRYIKQELISGHEGQILTDIAANKLYLRHIPESYDSGRHKDAAKFIMLTSAFEWEFRRTYPNGVQKSEKTLAIEKTATEAIELLFKNSSGKLRDKYRYLKKRIKDDPLQSEIEQIGTDFAEIIDLFGKRLYSLNDEKLVYTEMGKRLGDQRNHFAHGDLDKDFIDLSLLDLIFLERIVYAIQLRYYAIETPKIQNAINDLFHCGFALSQV